MPSPSADPAKLPLPGLEAKALRKKTGISQKRVSAMLGVTPSALCQHESQGKQLSADRQRALKKLLQDCAQHSGTPPSERTAVIKVCSNDRCPWVRVRMFEDGAVCLPVFFRAFSGHRTKCPICGHALTALCSRCQAGVPDLPAAVHCLTCGRPYLPRPEDMLPAEVDEYNSLRDDFPRPAMPVDLTGMSDLGNPVDFTEDE